MERNFIYNVVFENYLGEKLLIKVEENETIENLIHLYLYEKRKENLFIDNFENIYFIYKGHKINYKNKNKNVSFLFNYFEQPKIKVCRLDYNKDFSDIKIIEIIKDNILTCVCKAYYKDKIVAVKIIKKDKLKEQLEENLMVPQISEEEFKKEIIKFNRELKNMQLCHCSSSVEIYDYYNTKHEFIIIMELCDNNLLRVLANTNNGFNTKQIKEIYYNFS